MSEEMELELPELPHEVIIDILLRLPCKILVRCRCVSKQWNSLIRGRSFTQIHLGKSASGSRVLLRPKPFYSIRYDDLDDFVEYGFDVIVKDDIPTVLADVNMSCCDTRLVGVCNGLVCILLRKNEWNSVNQISESFLLWNPTIRECLEVCKTDISVEFGNHTSQILFDVYGFGYDSSTNDYKIVRLAIYDRPNKVVDVEIFRIGSRTLRKLELPVFGLTNAVQMLAVSFTGSCSLLNKACYWLMKKAPINDNLILSVDLEKEEVEEMTLPPYLRESRYIGELSVCGGKLVLANNVNELMEIWMMDEYGVGSSFTKKVTVRQVPGIKFTSYARPICFSRNGGILVYDGKRLAMYDPEKKTCKVARGTSWRRQYITMYAETLISPYHISNAAGIGNIRTV